MTEIQRRKLFTGWMYHCPLSALGCTIGQLIADTEGLNWNEIQNLLDADDADMDFWISEGAKFV